MFRTITAKYTGKCKRCNGAIEVGDRIRYGGPGRVYHLKANCETAVPTLDAEVVPETKTVYPLNSPQYEGLNPFKGGEEATELVDTF
jgi:hypothetical protein